MKAAALLRYGLAVMAAALAAVAGARAESAVTPAACSAPPDLIRLTSSLSRTGRVLAANGHLTVVAIGSSSTFGAGASSPDLSYPSRLAVELKELFPHAAIDVFNHGVNGEIASQMLTRFDNDIFAHDPDLVLWQVGSNSVLKDLPINEENSPLRDGLKRLRAAQDDVVLINPQYAPKVIAKHDVEPMVNFIHATAKETNVDVFDRFAVMRHWRESEGLPFSAFVSPDELHMNDWSYGCLAKLLAKSISEAATRPTLTATAARPNQ
jgi:lysophospholipase L1-like esterase